MADDFLHAFLLVQAWAYHAVRSRPRKSLLYACLSRYSVLLPFLMYLSRMVTNATDASPTTPSLSSEPPLLDLCMLHMWMSVSLVLFAQRTFRVLLVLECCQDRHSRIYIIPPGPLTSCSFHPPHGLLPHCYSCASLLSKRFPVDSFSARSCQTVV